MAARRDDWLQTLELESLLDTSAPKLEARLLALTREPRRADIASAAVRFFTEFPIRFREQLGAGAAGAGVAWLHGAKASAFAKLKPPTAPNDAVPTWHQRVTLALHAALGPRSKPSGRAELTPLPQKQLHEAWLERAHRAQPETLPSLLESFAKGPATQLAERGVVLLRWPVDARIADAAADFIVRPSVNGSPDAAIFTICALLLCVHGNRSHRQAAEHLSSTVPSLIWVERALPEVDAPAAPKKPRAATPKSEDDFLRFIAEAPRDDTRVALFMDWLLERDEPRGTFLSLQRSGTEKGQATLLKKHEKAWLGSMARAALKGRSVFRGGFARDVTLRCWRPADVPRDDEPLLALLEALDVHGGTNLAIPEWLSRAKFPSLRRLTSAPWILARVPDALLTPLDTLGLEGNFVKPAAELLAVLTRPLPHLRSLELNGDWREGVEFVARCKTLQRVRVETHEPARWESLRRTLTELDVRPAHERSR